MKNCSHSPMFFYFLRTSTCFSHNTLLEKDDETVRDEFSSVCNVNFDDFLTVQCSAGFELVV